MRREDVFGALEAILEAVPGIRTFGRRLVPWADVPPSEQPALYMLCANQTVTVEGRGIPPKRGLPVTLYLYSRNDDGPAVQNDLLDAIEAALEPKGEESLTLGGLVSHCRIEGEIETDEGLLDSQAVAVIPISILVP
jgi:hypothetical protein